MDTLAKISRNIFAYSFVSEQSKQKKLPHPPPLADAKNALFLRAPLSYMLAKTLVEYLQRKIVNSQMQYLRVAKL